MGVVWVSRTGVEQRGQGMLVVHYSLQRSRGIGKVVGKGAEGLWVGTGTTGRIVSQVHTGCSVHLYPYLLLCVVCLSHCARWLPRATPVLRFLCLPALGTPSIFIE